MLELIFQGFIEWIYSLVLECWNWFSTSLLDIMSLDLAYIRSHVPIITDIMQVLLAVGWALLLGNLVFQALKGMAAGLGFEAEDPKMLFGRSAVFSFLLLASPQICGIALDMTSRIITLLQLPNAVNVHLVDASILGNLLAGWLVVIVCNIIIMCKVLKLLLKIAEQYVVLSTLTITAPLAFAMGGSKSTAPIFTGWCRMYGSMCLLMVTNVMFFKMLLSVMSAIPSGLDVFPWMVLIFSIVKVAKRMDDTITRIGLNPAQTGGGGRSLPGMVAATVMHGAVSQVTKTLGGAMGGAVGAAGKGAVGAGTVTAGAAAGAASSGLGSTFRPGRSQNTSQQSNSQQVHNQQGGTQQSTTQQSQQNMTNAGQPAPQQTVPPTGGMAYTGGSNSTMSTSSTAGGNTSQNSRSSTTRHSRNSSVPSGTRRAPSYVRSTVSSQPGTAGTGTDSRSTETTVRGGSFGGGSRGSDFGSGSRAGGFGGGSRGGGFSNGRRTTTTTNTTTERDHDASRGGQFGERSYSGSTAGGSSRSSASSTIERNRSMIAKSGTTVEKATTNTSTGSSQTRVGSAGAAVPHPGIAGNTSGGTTAPRSGVAGTVHGGTAAPRPGMAGTAPGGTTAPHPGIAGTGANSQTAHQTGGSKPGSETPSTPRPGIVGTGINGQAAHRSGGAGSASGSPAAPCPDTAGTSTGSSALPNPGAAGTGASTVSAKGSTAQPGAAVSHSTSTRSTKITGKERASRTPISSGGAATPPAKTTAVQHTQSTESRSTRRSVTESRQSVTKDSVERTTHQSGTAGTAAPGTVRQPTAIPQPGRVVPPVTGPQPPKQARSSPAQQETRQSSVPAKAPVSGTPAVPRPGTAGTAPGTRLETPERTTARKPSESEKPGAKQPKAPSVKRQITPPAATGKKPGPKTPDRSRGGGHG